MKKLQFFIGFSLFLLLFFNNRQLNAQSKKVPGVVVNYIPASSKIYIGSPGICILHNGDYIASHDHFGPGSTEHQQALTSIYKSTNRGRSWQKISEIKGQFWSNLFVHGDALYIMGTWKHHGNYIIRRSTDGGISWSEPNDRKSGLLLEGEYHTAPVPVVIHKGRIWRALENGSSYTKAWGIRYSAMVISAAIDTDLLNAENWRATNSLPHDSAYLNGTFGGWLEGNVVVTPESNLVNILRVATSEAGRDMAAIVNVSDDGLSVSFDPASGFIDFAGGARKFTIRYDEESKRYWTITNMVTEEFRHLPASRVRNTLVLKSSPDLLNWTVHKTLLHHPDVERHGFQYVDWQFDGRDIIFLSRTAYNDKFGGANNFHDANFLTFHRIKRFRNKIKR